MIKPEKPHCEPKDNLVLKYILPKQEYTIKELEKEVQSWCDFNHIDVTSVKITWDEEWWGYEDVTISLCVSGVETNKERNRRNAEYQEKLLKYEEDLKEYKKLCSKQNKENQLKNKIKKIEKLEKQKADIEIELKKAHREIDKIC